MMVAIPLCMLMFYMAKYYVLKDEYNKLRKDYLLLYETKKRKKAEGDE